MDNTITITRKYTLIPTFSETKEWLKKIMEFTKDSYIQKIEYYEKKLEKTKKTDKENIEKIKSRLVALEEQRNNFNESGTLIQANVND